MDANVHEAKKKKTTKITQGVVRICFRVRLCMIGTAQLYAIFQNEIYLYALGCYSKDKSFVCYAKEI